MSNNQDEFSQTRNALFEVRNTITALEKASVLIVGKPDTSHNFKQNMLEEIDQVMKRLSALRDRMANI